MLATTLTHTAADTAAEPAAEPAPATRGDASGLVGALTEDGF